MSLIILYIYQLIYLWRYILSNNVISLSISVTLLACSANNVESENIYIICYSAAYYNVSIARI